jgi:hypothetical protein
MQSPLLYPRSMFSRQITSSVHKSRLDCGHIWNSNQEVIAWNDQGQPRGVCIECAQGISLVLSTNQSLNGA